MSYNYLDTLVQFPWDPGPFWAIEMPGLKAGYNRHLICRVSPETMGEV